jgi:hypothetical protein
VLLHVTATQSISTRPQWSHCMAQPVSSPWSSPSTSQLTCLLLLFPLHSPQTHLHAPRVHALHSRDHQKPRDIQHRSPQRGFRYPPSTRSFPPALPSSPSYHWFNTDFPRNETLALPSHSPIPLSPIPYFTSSFCKWHFIYK